MLLSDNYPVVVVRLILNIKRWSSQQPSLPDPVRRVVQIHVGCLYTYVFVDDTQNCYLNDGLLSKRILELIIINEISDVYIATAV